MALLWWDKGTPEFIIKVASFVQDNFENDLSFWKNEII